MTPVSPRLAESARRFAAARVTAREVVEGLSEADFHRKPPGGWFIAIAGHHERHLDQARRAREAIR
ncbi:MAG: hypothetical protein ABIP29_09870 [Candidatus Eisenbacteria bacterium]